MKIWYKNLVKKFFFFSILTFSLGTSTICCQKKNTHADKRHFSGKKATKVLIPLVCILVSAGLLYQIVKKTTPDTKKVTPDENDDFDDIRTGKMNDPLKLKVANPVAETTPDTKKVTPDENDDFDDIRTGKMNDPLKLKVASAVEETTNHEEQVPPKKEHNASTKFENALKHNEIKTIVLLDVDQTSIIPMSYQETVCNDNFMPHYNEGLFQAIKEKKIKDICLFTKMTKEKMSEEFQEGTPLTRQKLIQKLESLGCTVWGVITPGDIAYNKGLGAAYGSLMDRKLSLEEYGEYTQTKSDEMEGKTRMFQYFCHQSKGFTGHCILFDDDSDDYGTNKEKRTKDTYRNQFIFENIFDFYREQKPPFKLTGIQVLGFHNDKNYDPQSTAYYTRILTPRMEKAAIKDAEIYFDNHADSNRVKAGEPTNLLNDMKKEAVSHPLTKNLNLN